MTRKVRYGISGFGRFAEKTIAPAIKGSSNSELVAIQNRSRDKARAKALEWGVPLAFDSVEQMVSHPDVDALFIVSANCAHYPETIAAARAGKHVLVEKPIAMNVGEAEEMIATCERSKVKLMVGHMIRLSPLVVRMRDLLRNGEIGTPLFARADFVYDGRLSQRKWLYDRAIAGGGPVFDIGVHCLDTLRFILEDEVASVKSECEPWPTQDRTESIAHMVLRFNRGVIGSILCSFVSPMRRTSIELAGTDGVIAATQFTLSSTTVKLSVLRDDGLKPAVERVEEILVPNLYIDEVTHFSDCIRNNTEPFSPGRNGLLNQRVLDRAIVRPREGGNK